MNNLLLIEDEIELQELIVYNLEKEKNTKVVALDNANDALIALEDVQFDLILLDLMLPGLNGFDFLGIIKNRSETANLPVIIISAKTEEKDILKGLKAGADDYLTKPFSIKVLSAKVEAVLRRVKQHYKEAISYKKIKIFPDEYKTYVDGKELNLTLKEFELLLLLIQNPKKVFNRNQLLHSVWGYEAEVYTRTVDAHISTLRKKLGEQANLIKSVSKIGYGFDL